MMRPAAVITAFLIAACSVCAQEVGNALTEWEKAQIRRYGDNRIRSSEKDIYRHRPSWHFTSPENILHDPNGLCFFKGNWHLFYQAWPRDHRGPSWGHAVSKDLIHWQDLPLALWPEQEQYCYSGSVFPEEDRAIAAYYGRPIGEMVAVSEDSLLLRWTRITSAPVIPRPVPEDIRPGDGGAPWDTFDPFIWKEGEWYYMLSGLYSYDGPGGRRKANAFLFRSRDLVHWKYRHPFIENDCYTEIGGDLACPYFWPVGDRGKYALVHFSHRSGAEYLVGNFDRKREKFIVTNGGKINYGPEGGGGTHAPSCFPDGKGNLVCIFNARGKDLAPGTFTQCMTLPRLLSVDSDDRLVQKPYGDYESLRTNCRQLSDIALEDPGREVVLPGIEGKQLELILEFAPGTPSVEVDVLRSPDKKEFTRIVFYRDGGYPDRFYPGQDKRYSALCVDTSFGSVHSGAMRHIPETVDVFLEKDEALRLHIFIDRSIVEVFVNDREAVMLRTWPILPASTGVSVRTLGSQTSVSRVDCWDLERIWP